MCCCLLLQVLTILTVFFFKDGLMSPAHTHRYLSSDIYVLSLRFILTWLVHYLCSYRNSSSSCLVMWHPNVPHHVFQGCMFWLDQCVFDAEFVCRHMQTLNAGSVCRHMQTLNVEFVCRHMQTYWKRKMLLRWHQSRIAVVCKPCQRVTLRQALFQIHSARQLLCLMCRGTLLRFARNLNC